MRPLAGSFLWLVAHDLRRSRRRLRGMVPNLSDGMVWALIAAAFILFHLVAWPAATMLGVLEAKPDGRAAYDAALASGVAFIAPWLVAHALTGAARALYTIGDLDLLLTAPVSPRAILGARAVAIAVDAFSAAAIFLVPLADAAVLQGRLHGLAVVPTLAAASLIAAAAGLAFTLGLFKLVGPRRTRMIAQIAATMIGAAFVLGIQLLSVLPAAWRAAVTARFDHPSPGGLFDRHGPFWLPVRAAAGEWSALGAFSALAVLAFALTIVALGGLFARGIAAASGAPIAARRAARARAFASGQGRNLRRKEWRLVARDPWLLSQLVLQVVYTLPVSIILWRAEKFDVALSVAPCIVLVASQLAATLAWLTISSEDAPDFLAAAPVSRAAIERNKLAAIAAPVALFLAIPLGGLALISARAALWTALFCLAAATSTALLNLWHPVPAKRAEVMRRHAQSKIVAVLEHLMSALWALAMVLAALGSWAALAPIALACLVLALNRPRTRPSPHRTPAYATRSSTG